MFIYCKSVNGCIEEIYGPKVPQDCVAGQIVDVLGIGTGCNLHNVLLTLANCEIPVKQENSNSKFSYFAWLEIDRVWVSIMFAPMAEPNAIGQPEGRHITGFNGDKMPPERIFGHIIKRAFQTWSDLCEEGVRQMKALTNSIFVQI